MSRKTITMPQLGESVVEGTVGAWLKSVGDEVKRFEPLVEVITDKVNTEIPSEFGGILQEILVEEGQTVSVGTPLAVIDVEGAVPADATGTGRVDEPPAEPGIEPPTEPGIEPPAEPGIDRGVDPVLDLSAAPALEPSPPEAPTSAPMSSSAGEAAAPGQDPTSAGTSPASGVPETSSQTTAAALPRGVFSPLVRRLAGDYGVDLLQVRGTGAGGRVTKGDVLEFVQARQSGTAPTPTGVPVGSLAAVTPPGMSSVPRMAVEPGDEVITPDPMRRAIARHMSASKQMVPHAWTMMEADVTQLVALRQARKDAFYAAEGVALTYVPFFIKAVVESIKQFPHLNAAWQDDRIVVKKRIHVGIAVGLDDGLVVPVVRDADRLSISGIAHAVTGLIARARAGKLGLDDVQGGTITVNNTGAFGSVASYPIINQPQAAIITMETIRRTPVVIGDAIGIRSMMNMCISFDHRVTDGLYVGRFLQSVKQRLESYGPDTAL